MQKRKSITVLVFGVFDRLHPGHRAFLRQARRHGSRLIVAVARDRAAQSLKQYLPRESEHTRRLRVGLVPGVTRAVLGDRIQGSYGVIRRSRPDVICLGYDQRGLEKDLRQRMRARTLPQIALTRLRSYRPQRYHSSRLEPPFQLVPSRGRRSVV